MTKSRQVKIFHRSQQVANFQNKKPLKPNDFKGYKKMVPRAGIEPATRGFSVLCSTDWAIWASKWWAFRDLNPGPTGYEPGALTNWAKGPHHWRRKRDLNPRDPIGTYSLSRGASSATWVFLQIEGHSLATYSTYSKVIGLFCQLFFKSF